MSFKSILRPIYQLKLLETLFSEKTAREIEGWAAHCAKHIEQLDDFQNKIQAIQDFTQAQTLEAMEQLSCLSRDFMKSDLSIYFLKDLHLKALHALCRALNFSAVEWIDLVGSFQDNRTAQMSAEWENLISQLHSDPGAAAFIASLQTEAVDVLKVAKLYLRQDTHQMWEHFFKANGHIRTSWDIAKPSWREAPEKLAFILDAFINTNASKRQPPTSNRQQVLSRLLESIRASDHHRSIPMIEKTLSHLEKLMQLDEEQHFLSGILFEPSRKLASQAEQFFLQQGLLTEKGQIFFLTLSEIKAQLRCPEMNLTFLAIRRKMQWERNKANPKPIELSHNPKPQTDALDPLKDLCGYPVSPGCARGPIHYIEHLEDTRGIPSGAIMLTTSPNPTFAPIYSILSGMITVTGGPLSHGFVAAREAGLPAVSGICDAFQKLKPGMMVELNGDTGAIEILGSVEP